MQSGISNNQVKISTLIREGMVTAGDAVYCRVHYLGGRVELIWGVVLKDSTPSCLKIRSVHKGTIEHELMTSMISEYVVFHPAIVGGKLWEGFLK